MSVVRIYVLKCPDTQAVRYVGKTCRPLEFRLGQHLCDLKPTYRGRWIQKLKAQGKRPSIELLEETDEAQWPERERYWIERLDAEGCQLANTATGGLGRPMRDEAKHKSHQITLTPGQWEEVRSLLPEGGSVSAVIQELLAEWIRKRKAEKAGEAWPAIEARLKRLEGKAPPRLDRREDKEPTE